MMRRAVLNFHGLGTPKRDLETGEAPYWLSEDMFADILKLAGDLAGKVETTFTFDDGNASDIEIAAPLLATHGHTARFFVLADRIGGEGSLDEAALRALVAGGHTIGTHGAAHVDWSVLSEDAKALEWDAARTQISDAAGIEISEAAIPFGRYRASVLRGLKARDYTCAWSSDGGSWHPSSFLRPRTSPRQDMTRSDIENILLGHEPRKTRLRRRLAMAVKQRV